jgi:hypothetical protein
MPSASAVQPSRQWEENLFRTVGQHIKDEIKKRDQRIDALESKMANWKYCGVWSAGRYVAGNFSSHHGSLFVCLWSTEAQPGTDSSWQLCCKRGKTVKTELTAVATARMPTVTPLPNRVSQRRNETG